jgi:hypothetical protein
MYCDETTIATNILRVEGSVPIKMEHSLGGAYDYVICVYFLQIGLQYRVRWSKKLFTSQNTPI